MAFACQRDSYLKELVTKVVASEPSQFPIERDGKKVSVDVYLVTCEDTVLFPEGGGQNSDRGTLGDRRVLAVQRQGNKAVHVLQADKGTGAEPKVGENVLQVVDWSRRFDNMQQHTGQHLISALFEKILNIPTKSWWMAENGDAKPGVSFVELGVENLDEENICMIEESANAFIRQNLPVEVKMFAKGDEALENAKTRGLPDDHAGPIRVVEIAGVDSNMCCGTHVSSLSQLQVIKLMHTEKQKKQKSTKLFFLVGDRVMRTCSLMFQRERALSDLLRGGPSDHVSLATKLSGSVKVLQKSVETLAKDAAIKDAKWLKDQKPKYYISHRSEPTNEYVTTLCRELSQENITLLLTSGGGAGSSSSQVVFYSPDDQFLQLVERISEALEASFYVKDKWMYGKFSSLKKLPLADAIVKKHFEG